MEQEGAHPCRERFAPDTCELETRISPSNAIVSRLPHRPPRVILPSSVPMQTPLRFLAFAAILLGSVSIHNGAELQVAQVTGEGWRELTLEDFVNVNGDADTWTEKDGAIVCTGKPVGGARTRETFTNFEMVLEWKHQRRSGNSGVFLWCPESAFTDLAPGSLPRSGIEVQVLDLGYEEDWLKNKGVHSEWFTSHGDVFPVGASSMKAFTPQIEYTDEDGTRYTAGNPKSSRSFPTSRRTRGFGEWNHYYIRAINGEVRLWVNGEEVNGGNQCSPSTGYIALEAEGAPVEFRNLRIRELP